MRFTVQYNPFASQQHYEHRTIPELVAVLGEVIIYDSRKRSIVESNDFGYVVLTQSLPDLISTKRIVLDSIDEFEVHARQ